MYYSCKTWPIICFSIVSLSSPTIQTNFKNLRNCPNKFGNNLTVFYILAWMCKLFNKPRRYSKYWKLSGKLNLLLYWNIIPQQTLSKNSKETVTQVYCCYDGIKVLSDKEHFIGAVNKGCKLTEPIKVHEKWHDLDVCEGCWKMCKMCVTFPWSNCW